MVAEGCDISGTLDFSILFSGVTIEEGALVRDSIIMPNTIIRKNAVVEYAIIGQNCDVGEDVVIGARPELIENKNEWGIAVIGHDVSINAGATIKPKQMVENNI